MADCQTTTKKFFAPLTGRDHWHRTLNLSVFEAGDSINQVPDQAEAVFDIRYTEKDDVDDLVRGRRRCVDAGADPWHQQELLYLHAIVLQRQRITGHPNLLTVQVIDHCTGALLAELHDFSSPGQQFVDVYAVFFKSQGGSLNLVEGFFAAVTEGAVTQIVSQANCLRQILISP